MTFSSALSPYPHGHDALVRTSHLSLVQSLKGAVMHPKLDIPTSLALQTTKMRDCEGSVPCKKHRLSIACPLDPLHGYSRIRPHLPSAPGPGGARR